MQYEEQLKTHFYKKFLNIDIRYHQRGAALERIRILKGLNHNTSLKYSVLSLLLKLKGGTYLALTYQKLARKLNRSFIKF